MVGLGLPPLPVQHGRTPARSNASKSSKRCLSARIPSLPPITERQEHLETQSKKKGNSHRRAVSLPPAASDASGNGSASGFQTPRESEATREAANAEAGLLKDEVQELLKSVASFDDDMKAEAIRRKKMRERTAAAAKSLQALDSDGTGQQLSDGVRDLYQNVSRLHDHRKEQEGLRQLLSNRKVRDVKRRLEKQQRSGAPTSTGEAVQTTLNHISEMHQQRLQISELRNMMADLSKSAQDQPSLELS